MALFIGKPHPCRPRGDGVRSSATAWPSARPAGASCPPATRFYQMNRGHLRADGPLLVTRTRSRIRTSSRSGLGERTVKQAFNTSDRPHKIPRCIEWVTSPHAGAGDVLAPRHQHRRLSRVP